MENPTSPERAAENHASRAAFRWLLGIGILVACAGAGWWALNAFSPGAGIGFMPKRYAAITVSELSAWGTRAVYAPEEGELADYARGASGESVIVRGTDGNWKVRLLGAEEVVVADDASRKAAIAVAPDGSGVAYARYGGEEGAVFSPFLSDWEVVYHDLGTGEVFELGEGFSPEFFSRDGKNYLLYTDVAGIQVFNRGDRTAYGIPLATGGTIDSAATIQEEGRYLAYRNFITNRYELLSIVDTNGSLTLAAQGVLANGALIEDVAWQGQGLVVTSPVVDGTVLFGKIDLALPAEITQIAKVRSSEAFRIITF